MPCGCAISLAIRGEMLAAQPLDLVRPRRPGCGRCRRAGRATAPGWSAGPASETSVRSSVAPVLICAPSRSRVSAIWVELSVVVPSSSRSAIRVLQAVPVRPVGGIAGIERHRDADHRHGGAAGEDDLDAVRQAGMLDRREVKVGDLPDRRQMRAVDLVEAARRAEAVGAGGRRRVGRERLLVRRRRAVISGACRRCGPARARRPPLPDKARARPDRRAAHRPAGSASAASPRGRSPESARRAPACDGGRNRDRSRRARPRRARPPCRRSRRPARGRGYGRRCAGDVALHLVGGRAFGDEAADDLVEPARDRVGIAPGLQVDLDLEDADPVEGLDVGIDRDGALVAADQRIVEPRAGEAAEHAGGDVERRLQSSRMPGTIHSR